MNMAADLCKQVSRTISPRQKNCRGMMRSALGSIGTDGTIRSDSLRWRGSGMVFVELTVPLEANLENAHSWKVGKYSDARFSK